MIARFRILLPYEIATPVGEQYSDFKFDYAGYKISIIPPFQTDLKFSDFANGRAPTITYLIEHLVPVDQPVVNSAIKVNNQHIIECNALQIDFQAENFNRVMAGDGSVVGYDSDPPTSIVVEVANIFLVHLRTVTQSSQAQPLIEGSNFPWTIQYLNDDGSELTKVEGLMRKSGKVGIQFHVIPLTKSIWEQVKIIDIEYTPPNFQSLILDAEKILPDIGASMVLAFSSIESIISWGLRILSKNSLIPKDLDFWIFEKDDKSKLPSIAEKLDILLRIFSGKSLKEDKPQLWVAFQQLKKIRNDFVHKGVLELNGTDITLQQAREYIESTKQILNFVESLLPKNMTRPLSTDRYDLEFVQILHSPPTPILPQPPITETQD